MVVLGTLRRQRESREGGDGNMADIIGQLRHSPLRQSNGRASSKPEFPGKEALPVVELKPFSRKVWRREKSLPNNSDKVAFRRDEVRSEPRSPTLLQRGPSSQHHSPHSMLCLKSVYSGWTSPRHGPNASRPGRHSSGRPRCKTLHPRADFTLWAGSLHHQQDLIPGFVTRQERGKNSSPDDPSSWEASSLPSLSPWKSRGTTETERIVKSKEAFGTVEMEGGLSREFSNLMSAYTRDKPLQLQEERVCLTGGHLSTDNLNRHRLQYLKKPRSAYGHKQGTSRVNSHQPASPRLSQSLPNPRHGGTLGWSRNRADLVFSSSSLQYMARAGVRSAKVHTPHKFHSKLGAAQDSLHLLSQTGPPTALERNLSFQQEIQLQNCRREKSFAGVGDSNVLSSAHYVAYDTQPTPGEVTLMKGRQANQAATTTNNGGPPMPAVTIPSAGEDPDLTFHDWDQSLHSLHEDTVETTSPRFAAGEAVKASQIGERSSSRRHASVYQAESDKEQNVGKTGERDFQTASIQTWMQEGSVDNAWQEQEVDHHGHTRDCVIVDPAQVVSNRNKGTEKELNTDNQQKYQSPDEQFQRDFASPDYDHQPSTPPFSLPTSPLDTDVFIPHTSHSHNRHLEDITEETVDDPTEKEHCINLPSLQPVSQVDTLENNDVNRNTEDSNSFSRSDESILIRAGDKEFLTGKDSFSSKVETVVPVSLDTEGSFNRSKTFINASKVELDDWQGLVKA